MVVSGESITLEREDGKDDRKAVKSSGRADCFPANSLRFEVPISDKVAVSVLVQLVKTQEKKRILDNTNPIRCCIKLENKWVCRMN